MFGSSSKPFELIYNEESIFISDSNELRFIIKDVMINNKENIIPSKYFTEIKFNYNDIVFRMPQLKMILIYKTNKGDDIKENLIKENLIINLRTTYKATHEDFNKIIDLI